MAEPKHRPPPTQNPNTQPGGEADGPAEAAPLCFPARHQVRMLFSTNHIARISLPPSPVHRIPQPRRSARIRARMVPIHLTHPITAGPMKIRAARPPTVVAANPIAMAHPGRIGGAPWPKKICPVQREPRNISATPPHANPPIHAHPHQALASAAIRCSNSFSFNCADSTTARSAGDSRAKDRSASDALPTRRSAGFAGDRLGPAAFPSLSSSLATPTDESPGSRPVKPPQIWHLALLTWHFPFPPCPTPPPR